MIESIKMLERRFNLFPATFAWQGRIYQVDAVNECKTTPDPDGHGLIYHFWVRCGGQRLHLYQQPAGHWLLHLE